MFVFWRDVWFPDKVAAELDAKNTIPNFELLLGFLKSIVHLLLGLWGRMLSTWAPRWASAQV